MQERVGQRRRGLLSHVPYPEKRLADPAHAYKITPPLVTLRHSLILAAGPNMSLQPFSAAVHEFIPEIYINKYEPVWKKFNYMERDESRK